MNRQPFIQALLLLTLLALPLAACAPGEAQTTTPAPASPTTPPAVIRQTATPKAPSGTPGAPTVSPSASLTPTITATFTPTLPSAEPTIPVLAAPFAACPQAPLSQLSVGIYAYINQPDPGALRQSAGSSAAVVSNLAVGSAVLITGGPDCVAEGAWWQVQTLNGETGWMQEVEGALRRLVPIPYKPGNPLALPQERVVCPQDDNTPNSRLNRGLYAYVSLTPATPNLVRATPGNAGVIRFQFEPGKVMAILDGPTCADGKVWWQVRSLDGETGWTAEGDPDGFWLVPVPFKPGLQPGEFACSAVREIPLEECQVLVDLYTGTGGGEWKNNYGWLQSLTPCAWYGVSCTGGSVSGLALSDNDLTGAVPKELGNLQGLTSLKLDDNPLSGPLPFNLRQAPALTQFWYNGTNTCEPEDKPFQDWLKGLPDRISNGKVCVAGSVPTEDLRPDDGAQLVSETIPDGSVMAPGQFFTKQWVLKNVGKNTWNSTYAMVFVGGTRMDAPVEIVIPATIRSGTNLTIFVEMTAPSQPGTYTAYFLLRNPSGQTFGVGPGYLDSFYAQIKVK